jgi:GGDEF domain-containing protein
MAPAEPRQVMPNQLANAAPSSTSDRRAPGSHASGSVSVGDEVLLATDAIVRADQALYRARRRGRDRVEVG